MLAHFGKTELAVIHMSAVESTEEVAQAKTNTTEKIKAYFCDRRHTCVARRQ
jgi:hypothetical protein